MSGTLNNALQTIMYRPTRQIGTIIPDCAVEERHTDLITITQHPVERGSPINDHYFRAPSEVILRWGWSNSSPQNAFSGGALGILTAAIGFGSESYANEIYEDLLKLQLSGKTFELVTGRKTYPRMMMTSLTTETNNATTYGLSIEAVCTEVIITQTRTVTYQPETQQDPKTTAATAAPGPQQPYNTVLPPGAFPPT